jgi:hypothetical protein
MSGRSNGRGHVRRRRTRGSARRAREGDGRKIYWAGWCIYFLLFFQVKINLFTWDSFKILAFFGCTGYLYLFSNGCIHL